MRNMQIKRSDLATFCLSYGPKAICSHQIWIVQKLYIVAWSQENFSENNSQFKMLSNNNIVWWWRWCVPRVRRGLTAGPLVAGVTQVMDSGEMRGANIRNGQHGGMEEDNAMRGPSILHTSFWRWQQRRFWSYLARMYEPSASTNFCPLRY